LGQARDATVPGMADIQADVCSVQAAGIVARPSVRRASSSRTLAHGGQRAAAGVDYRM
jgi:hypothetical protein